jgi:hypothetical protein
VQSRALVVRRLNPTELKDRKDRGLCFNYDKKFSPGHSCQKLFLIEGVYEEEAERSSPAGEGVVEEEEEFVIPEISLQAISGGANPANDANFGNHPGGTGDFVG